MTEAGYNFCQNGICDRLAIRDHAIEVKNQCAHCFNSGEGVGISYKRSSNEMDSLMIRFASWPGIAVRRTASLPLAFPGHPRLIFLLAPKTWMPGIADKFTQSAQMQTATAGHDDLVGGESAFSAQ